MLPASGLLKDGFVYESWMSCDSTGSIFRKVIAFDCI